MTTKHGPYDRAPEADEDDMRKATGALMALLAKHHPERASTPEQIEKPGTEFRLARFSRDATFIASASSANITMGR